MRGALLAGIALVTILSAGLIGRPGVTRAQTPASLSDESALSLVLPPLADGSRPGVHLWARADQFQGPGGLPTVFIVTLYTKQTASGPEEHEVVNYVQYSGGSWVAARPRDDGTLLVDDWAWISLNLTNLTAVATGQGSNSQYTVDYTSSGTYAGSPRQILLEEVYAADLSLVSSVVLSDTNPVSLPAASSATPAPSPAPRPAAPVATATALAVPATATTLASTPVSGSPRAATPSVTSTPGLPVR